MLFAVGKQGRFKYTHLQDQMRAFARPRHLTLWEEFNLGNLFITGGNGMVPAGGIEPTA
jgi:hypothetical protein